MPMRAALARPELIARGSVWQRWRDEVIGLIKSRDFLAVFGFSVMGLTVSLLLAFLFPTIN